MNELQNSSSNKVRLRQLIHTKEREKYIQVTMLLASLILIPFTLLFSLYLMGLTHAIGTIYWKFAYRDIYKIQGRRIIEPINILVTILLLISVVLACFVRFDIMGPVTMGILIIGPILGISYYVITLKEISFYRKMEQHERA
jgi:hypothetical protein